MIIKDYKPVIKDVLGLGKALKIEAADLDKQAKLYLLVALETGEKAFPLVYNEEKNDFRVYHIPNSISDEQIVEGKVVAEENSNNISH